MKEIVERLTENRNIERAKSILESNGYKVEKRVNEEERTHSSNSKLMSVAKFLFPSAPDSSFKHNYCAYDKWSRVLHYLFDSEKYSMEQFISDMESIGATEDSEGWYITPARGKYHYRLKCSIPTMQKDTLSMYVKELE